MRLDYFLYMAEAEGHDNLVNTRRAKLNAIGKDLQKSGYVGQTVPGSVFLALCNRHKLDNITQEDINYIEEEWLWYESNISWYW